MDNIYRYFADYHYYGTVPRLDMDGSFTGVKYI